MRCSRTGFAPRRRHAAGGRAAARLRPDFLDNYELGFKSRWDGGRYTLNLTAFKMKWEDYQVEVVDPGSPPLPVLYAVMVTNVGDAEIEGVSLDFTAYLWDSLDVG
jgi:outer membrane receptor protein involved in Fe transport